LLDKNGPFYYIKYMGTIYILENKINGMCYVGQTTQSFNDRFRQHNQSHSYIGSALRKHGVDNFKKILLEDVPEEKMDEIERENIIKYNSIFPNGYNFETGGHENKHLHEETKNKISESEKGKIVPEEVGRKISEAKTGVPSGRKGISLPEETKEKISQSLTGKMIGELNPFFGKHHTEETLEKNRIAHTGKVGGMNGVTQTDEARHLMSIAKKGNTYRRGSHHTPEANEKNRIAHLGVSPGNKGIRIPHLCPVCKNPVKEKYNLKGEFKGYQKTCGNLICVKSLRKVKLVV